MPSIQENYVLNSENSESFQTKSNLELKIHPTSPSFVRQTTRLIEKVCRENQIENTKLSFGRNLIVKFLKWFIFFN